MGVQFHPLPVDVFPDEARPYIARLNIELRELFGLEGVIRNPIIVAELSVVWGEALYFAALGIAVYAALAMLAAHLVVTRIEEPDLRERFGAPYDAYSQRVPRWCPRLRIN